MSGERREGQGGEGRQLCLIITWFGKIVVC